MDSFSFNPTLLVAHPQRAWVISRLLRVLLTLAVLAVVAWQLAVQHYLLLTNFTLTRALVPYLLGGMGLLVLNYLLEAAKWRLLTRKVLPNLTLPQALHSVLTGLALGFITPARAGEYVGRLWGVAPPNRQQALWATALSFGVQQWVCLLGGGLGTGALVAQGLLPHWYAIVAGISLLLALGMPVLSQIKSYPRWGLLRHLQGLRQLWVVTPLLQLALLAACRYAVFIAQYYCMLWAVGYQGPTGQAIAAIAVVYLLKNLVPAVALAELGIREVVALAVMGSLLHWPAPLVLHASLLVYLLGVVLPALAGALLLMPRRWAGAARHAA